MFDVVSGCLMWICYIGFGGIVEYSNLFCWGFLEDYVFVVWGLLDLYEVLQESVWFEWVLWLQDIQDRFFWDFQGGGYFCSEVELGVGLFLCLKDDQDGVEFSVNFVLVYNLFWLYGFMGYKDWMDKCVCLLIVFFECMCCVLVVLFEMVCVFLVQQQIFKQIVICGDCQVKDIKVLVQCVYFVYIFNKVLILVDGDFLSFLFCQLFFLSIF